MRTIKAHFFKIALTALLLLTKNFTASAQALDSLDVKIGQMILIGFPGPAVDAKVLDEVKRGMVGSIILFEKNIPAKNSFVDLKKIVWTYQHAAPIPLFVGIDQEGGRVNRLKDKYGFPRSITAAAMGKSPTLDSVRFYGEATASTLAGLGINVNFAPVVDLASNPNNPIIAKFGRAFSANEDSVALLAKEYIKAHHRYGVLTSLKHFPGHGSSKDDTHLGIADVTNTWEERELKPYQVLIDSGYADAVMTSHIVNRKLDKAGNPGTLSADILTGVLRNKLKFGGVIFTDDMQMHAITKHYGLEEAIRLAINGGVDIMTFSNNISGSDQRTVDAVHSIIRKMVEKGEIKKERIDESYRRVMKLKSQLNAGDRATYYQQQLGKANVAVEEANQRAKQTLLEAQAMVEKVKQEAAAAQQPKKKKKRKKD
ncbi:glycoside hydrolase family 3 protein [Chryseolinea lacunae]|uniref:beta-N-acetylhexosaminidase n=1 Tax=Chryseolinea lacunae TaxID=2801331 RepID=A0ABS1KQM9_9BACT|nr:glycoside hydrolase family 3 N-terminal domain-containing protein [Chryseolinea lacunae]MBL0741746.1 glycoside hydrolase family 3 protein [Chryseolinea lacunae]